MCLLIRPSELVACLLTKTGHSLNKHYPFPCAEVRMCPKQKMMEEQAKLREALARAQGDDES